MQLHEGPRVHGKEHNKGDTKGRPAWATASGGGGGNVL